MLNGNLFGEQLMCITVECIMACLILLFCIPRGSHKGSSHSIMLRQMPLERSYLVKLDAELYRLFLAQESKRAGRTFNKRQLTHS